MKNRKKAALNILFLAGVFGLTFYLLLKDQELSGIWASLQQAQPGWLIAGLLLVIVFVCSESVIIHYMMGKLEGIRPKLGQCVKYSFVGFFYSCVTPSASGGQPMQVYYMKKDGIPVSVSTLVLMVITILYKLVLVVFGLLILAFLPGLMETYLSDTKFFLYLGLGLNILFISGMLILVFAPSFAKRLAMGILRLLERIHIIKEKEERRRRLAASMDKYHATAQALERHKSVLATAFMITVFQRICLFLVTWLVYKSFGFSGTPLWKIVMLQSVISIDVDMLPLPGGIGASESLFLHIFMPVFGSAMVLPAMLLSRGINYYALVLISAAVSLYAHLTAGRRQSTIGREEKES
ncbi:lysylphosphatidylglycerol synthase transmembrane domain-containing protein [Cuneatibacter caecimuris]|uniref:Phosphatidylglycerol lysyltransferase n=1 Tax=Cuneatibacter caecimuris TaxID=1796618 RepID=A0A4V2F890_9FIRM|nr:lysylphosphatidylglycerol synthase transmembrane domain-containing protein [Cuneatibacter caecimuris]RZT02587.1 hypothetical protein EV209_0708 [Cuneatibacter caecimuris]